MFVWLFPQIHLGKFLSVKTQHQQAIAFKKEVFWWPFLHIHLKNRVGKKKSVNSLFNKFSVSTGNCMSKRSVFEINSKVEIAGKRCARLESQSRQGAGTAEHQHVWGHDQNDVIPTNSHTPLTLAFYLSPALTHSLSHTHSYTHTHTHTLSEASARYNWTSTRLGP